MGLRMSERGPCISEGLKELLMCLAAAEVSKNKGGMAQYRQYGAQGGSRRSLCA